MNRIIIASLFMLLPIAAHAQGINNPGVVGPGSATSGHIATFNGTSGKIIQDGGAVPTSAPCSSFGTTAGTCAQGNDSRITNAAQQTIGTWVPVDNSGAGLTFSSVSAGYTQIGNMVHAYFNLTYPATVNTNSAVIGGLPVSSANSGYSQQCMLTFSSFTSLFYLLLGQNSKLIYLFGSPIAAITNAQMAGVQILGECIYPAT